MDNSRIDEIVPRNSNRDSIRIYRRQSVGQGNRRTAVCIQILSDNFELTIFGDI